MANFSDQTFQLCFKYNINIFYIEHIQFDIVSSFVMMDFSYQPTEFIIIDVKIATCLQSDILTDTYPLKYIKY
jgi:hypothetical protein